MTKRMEMRSDGVLHSQALDAIDVALDVLRVPEQPSSIRGQHGNQPSRSRLPPYAGLDGIVPKVKDPACILL